MQIIFWYSSRVTREPSCAGRGGLVVCATSVWASQLLPLFQIHGTKGNCFFFSKHVVLFKCESMFFPHFPLIIFLCTLVEMFTAATFSLFPIPLACVYFPICDGIQMMLVSQIPSQARVFVVCFCLLPRQDNVSTQRIWGGWKKLAKVKGTGFGLWK